MKAFFAEEQKRHDPSFFLSSGAPQPNPEQPERTEHLLSGARAAGLEILRPSNHGLGPISAIHTPEYIDFLKRIYERWQRIEGASAEVIRHVGKRAIPQLVIDGEWFQPYTPGCGLLYDELHKRLGIPRN